VRLDSDSDPDSDSDSDFGSEPVFGLDLDHRLLEQPVLVLVRRESEIHPAQDRDSPVPQDATAGSSAPT
jgi:hypothetical protein